MGPTTPTLRSEVPQTQVCVDVLDQRGLGLRHDQRLVVIADPRHQAAGGGVHVAGIVSHQLPPSLGSTRLVGKGTPRKLGGQNRLAEQELHHNVHREDQAGDAIIHPSRIGQAQDQQHIPRSPLEAGVSR